MKRIEICNLKSKRPTEPYDFRIDRGLPVGNPYCIDGCHDRADVCTLYMEWFHTKLSLAVDAEFMDHLKTMQCTLENYGHIRLFCWCYPEQCHGSVIQSYLEDTVP